MMKVYIYQLVLIVFISYPALSYGQCGVETSVITASDHDDYGGVYDTLCVGGCERFWVKNADCPEFTGIGFHWVFYGRTQNDTLVGNTVMVCFPDTGVFLWDIYASNFNVDSAWTLHSRNVIIPCAPTAAFTATPQTVCANQPVTFSDQSTGLITGWQWSFAGGTPDTYNGKDPPPIYYADTGMYAVELSVSNQYGNNYLQKTDYIHVMPAPAPVAVETSFQLKEGDEVTLYTCALGNSYQWQPPVAVLENEDTLLTIQPDETQNYTCTVATANGCTATCSYEVNVQSGLLLPTAFSPNGDGVNDIFRILNTNIILQSFEIYNRWGGLVFQTNDIQSGWDGNYENREQPIGVYVWLANYVITKTGKPKTAKGNVTLVR